MKAKEGKTILTYGEVEGEGLIEVSVSRMKKWKACQWAHDYKYVDKLRPKAKVRPLTLGSLVHECLEQRALGNDWVQTIRNFRDGEWSKLFEEEKIELGDIPMDAYRIMRGYHQFYKESDKRYETIAAEVPFAVRITPKQPVVLVGIIDLILRDTTDGSIWCFEHKTAKKDIPTEDFRSTDVQTILYIWVMEKLADQLGYEPNMVKGVVIDYLKTKAPVIPEVLKNGTLSKRKITCDYETYLSCIKKVGGDPADYAEVLDYMKTNVFYRRIPITRSKELVNSVLTDTLLTACQIKDHSGCDPVRNLSWTCDRPRCEYRDLCMADLMGFDTSTIIKLNFDKGGEEENGKESDESE